jgi:cell division protein FtsI (penicillin-binding protein 3)
MAAAQMRKMMEGVVLYGTGKEAQLNGYSSGGKTGTAQKVDPATHLYSKTMHIASFAGIAPVNNPAIAVAVVIDNPKVGSYYGTAVSAPVFAEVAQQVLEYLGVPHDIEVQQPRTPAKKDQKIEVAEDDSGADQDNVNALFAAVNDLPADDPLRTPPAQANAQSSTSAPSPTADAKQESIGAQSSAVSDPSQTTTKSSLAQPAKSFVQKAAAPQVLTINDGKKLTVPTLIGMPVRKVIEVASAAGLDVEIVGSGTAREQAPAPGTQVPIGTKIVVHCGR